MTMTDETLPTDKPSLNYYIEEKTGHIIYEGDWYFPIDQVSSRRPLTTGAPKITYQKHYIWIGRNKLLNKPVIGVFKTSNECSIYKIINHNVRKEGGLQFALIGQYGFAKSTILSTIEANLLARKHRILQFDNMAMECQKLAFHGYFTKDGLFHPFKIIIWIPEGYEFDTSAQNYKPMIRNNVIIRMFQSAEDIVNEMKPHTINSVYKDALDSASFLRLFMDLINEISRRTTRDKAYTLIMHEFANLFPEGSSGDVYHNIRQIALEALRNIRKWNIGMVGSFHKPYDVAYFIGQKFNMIGQVRPFPQKTLSPLEKVARNYKKGDIAIAAGAHYRKHHINELPTSKTIYIYNANPIPFYYDSEYGPIDQLTLAINLEKKRIEEEEEKIRQKELARQQKTQEKLLDFDLKKKQKEEERLNKEYIIETEARYKKEEKEFETQQKLLLKQKDIELQKLKQDFYLLKQGLKNNKTLEKQQKQNELLDRAKTILKNNSNITNSELAKQLHINYSRIKTIRKEAEKLLLN